MTWSTLLVPSFVRRVCSAANIFFALLLLPCHGQAAPAVASFTASGTTICQDSCLTFASTSTGTIDSIRWKAVMFGMTFLLNNTTSCQFCSTPSIPAGMTCEIRLVVYGGGVADSSSVNITVNKTPHPIVTKSGYMLSIGGSYLSYQWYNGITSIPGATTATYTYASAGNYSVLVDSGGCGGYSDTLTIHTLNLSDEQTPEHLYWTSQTSNDGLQIYSRQPLIEEMRIEITDQAGRKMIVENWMSGTSAHLVDTRVFARGIYYIVISSRDTRKVLQWSKI
jgi:hypothetical protein